MLYIFMTLDPYEDQYEKRKTAKKERIAKNEYQRLRNIAKNTKKGGKLFVVVSCWMLYVNTHSGNTVCGNELCVLLFQRKSWLQVRFQN